MPDFFLLSHWAFIMRGNSIMLSISIPLEMSPGPILLGALSDMTEQLHDHQFFFTRGLKNKTDCHNP